MKICIDFHYEGRLGGIWTSLRWRYTHDLYSLLFLSRIFFSFHYGSRLVACYCTIVPYPLLAFFGGFTIIGVVKLLNTAVKAAQDNHRHP